MSLEPRWTDFARSGAALSRKTQWQVSRGLAALGQTRVIAAIFLRLQHQQSADCLLTTFESTFWYRGRRSGASRIQERHRSNCLRSEISIKSQDQAIWTRE